MFIFSPEFLTLISLVIVVGANLAYIKEVIAGKVQPNRVTYFVWTFACIVGTVAALSAGANLWSTSRIFLAGLMPCLVLIATFFSSQKAWKLSTFDVVCGSFSLLAILLWYFAESPRSAVILAAGGDCLAAVPTIIKSWRYPETENVAPYLAGLIALLLAIPSIPVWNIENAGFQSALFVSNLILVVALLRPRKTTTTLQS